MNTTREGLVISCSQRLQAFGMTWLKIDILSINLPYFMKNKQTKLLKNKFGIPPIESKILIDICMNDLIK